MCADYSDVYWHCTVHNDNGKYLLCLWIRYLLFNIQSKCVFDFSTVIHLETQFITRHGFYSFLWFSKMSFRFYLLFPARGTCLNCNPALINFGGITFDLIQDPLWFENKIWCERTLKSHASKTWESIFDFSPNKSLFNSF